MRRIRGAKWFAILRRRSHAVAKRLGVEYPSDDPNTMRKVHMQAELELGERLRMATDWGRS